jgi:hypothetical protein
VRVRILHASGFQISNAYAHFHTHSDKHTHSNNNAHSNEDTQTTHANSFLRGEDLQRWL